MEGIADALLPKLLSAETVAKRPEIVKRVRKMIVETAPEGAAAALRGMAQRQDQTAFLSRIIAPTLIIVGSEDALTPVADSETHASRDRRLTLANHRNCRACFEY